MQYISTTGLQELKSKQKLLADQIDDLNQQITENREQESGDESDNSIMRLNSELHGLCAKENEIREYIKGAKVVDIDSLKGQKTDTVRFGSLVKLQNIETDEELSYRILGVHEANPKNKVISYQSPMGSALISKSIGDEVCVVTPNGEIELEILDIRY